MLVLLRFAAMTLAGAMLVSCTRGTVEAIPVAPTPVVRKLTITPLGGITIVFGASAAIVSSGASPSNAVLGAYAEYSDGSGRYVAATWTSSNSNVVSVDGTTVTAIGRGTAIVSAAVQGHSDDEQFVVIGGIAGTWAGTYVVEQCGGTSGSASDLMCAPPVPGRQPGVAYVGATLPITLELTVNGTDIIGTVAFGNLRGTVTGQDRGGGLFSLRGVIQGAVVLTIAHWDTQVRGDELHGFIAYGVQFSGLPGAGSAAGRLVNVTRR